MWRATRCRCTVHAGVYRETPSILMGTRCHWCSVPMEGGVSQGRFERVWEEMERRRRMASAMKRAREHVAAKELEVMREHMLQLGMQVRRIENTRKRESRERHRT